jgi:hypothetical protein
MGMEREKRKRETRNDLSFMASRKGKQTPRSRDPVTVSWRAKKKRKELPGRHAAIETGKGERPFRMSVAEPNHHKITRLLYKAG